MSYNCETCQEKVDGDGNCLCTRRSTWLQSICWRWNAEGGYFESHEKDGVVVRLEIIKKVWANLIAVYAYTTNEQAKQKFPELSDEGKKEYFTTDKLDAAMLRCQRLAIQYLSDE